MVYYVDDNVKMASVFRGPYTQDDILTLGMIVLKQLGLCNNPKFKEKFCQAIEEEYIIFYPDNADFMRTGFLGNLEVLEDQYIIGEKNKKKKRHGCLIQIHEKQEFFALKQMKEGVPSGRDLTIYGSGQISLKLWQT